MSRLQSLVTGTVHYEVEEGGLAVCGRKMRHLIRIADWELVHDSMICNNCKRALKRIQERYVASLRSQDR